MILTLTIYERPGGYDFDLSSNFLGIWTGLRLKGRDFHYDHLVDQILFAISQMGDVSCFSVRYLDPELGKVVEQMISDFRRAMPNAKFESVLMGQSEGSLPTRASVGCPA